MFSVVITINDLFEFEGKPAPATRPDNAAIEAMVQRQFQFLPQPLKIEVRDTDVAIFFNEESAAAKEEAVRLAARASKRAAEGDYPKAISAWKRALELQPTLHAARRELAMVCVERGDAESAKNHLIEVLRLNPQDHWAYVVLANLYVADGDLATGEKFMRRALDLVPNDPWALNGMAAIAGKRGQNDEAMRLFERAIAVNPEFSNPRHGLALTLQRMGKLEEAETALEALFTIAKAQDVRSAPAFASGRALYAEVEKTLAEKRHSDAFKVVENLRAEVEQLSGYPVRVTEGVFRDKTGATIQMAWKHGSDHHLITLRKSFPSQLLTHLSAHELSHLRLEAEARKVGKNRFFLTNTATEEIAMQRLQNDIRKLQRKGYPQDAANRLAKSLVVGLMNFLYNCPLDMMIETQLRERLPVLRAAQFESLMLMADEAWQISTNPEIGEVTPPIIMRANMALNGAFALFLDHLFRGASDVASRFKKSETFGLSQRLFQLWQARFPQLGPGDEYALVDEFGEMLGLRGWFGWKDDPGAHKAKTPALKEGTTNPELLQQKLPAAVWHLLDALKRFAKLTPEQVRQIAFEIGTVGRNGLDYASPEPKYRLQTLPGESFTGLQLMCLMFAGFKKIAPDHDLGMNLEEPFLQALELFNAQKNKS